MIVKIDPAEYDSSSTVQLDSDAGNQWLAIGEIEDWASSHGFVRTSELNLRQVLVGGKRRFRTVCYRISEEELKAAEDAQARVVMRGDLLRGKVPISLESD